MPTHTDRPRRTRVVLIACVVVCSLAMILAGARGAWLGTLVGLVGLLLLRTRERVSGAFLNTAFVAAAVLVVVRLTGLDALAWERVAGSATGPLSLQQRLDAADAVFESWRQIPVTGVGPGGVAEVAHRAGMRVLNIENEYFIIFLTAGFLGLALFALLLGRRLLACWSPPTDRQKELAFVVLVALSVNIATYNTFAWSRDPLCSAPCAVSFPAGFALLDRALTRVGLHCIQPNLRHYSANSSAHHGDGARIRAGARSYSR